MAFDQNGIISQRRLSRAYDQPIVQHTNKGVVVRPDLGGASESFSACSTAPLTYKFEVLGGIVAKGMLGSLAFLGALVSVMGRASLEHISQMFGFMVLLVVAFLACTGSFYWWGSTGGVKVHLTVRKVFHIYLLCVSSDIVSRLVSVFMAFPPTAGIPLDMSYFVILTTLLLFIFALFIHKEGLNAMFAQETVFFVVCTMILNFSTSCLFSNILPIFMLPHLVYVGALLGLSFSLVGYQFPKFSLSRIYKTLNQAEPPPYFVSPEPALTVSGDTSTSRKDSLSSNVSSLKQRSRVSASSFSSFNSFYPQGFDAEVASEARGLLSDLLIQKDSLPSDTHQKLRRIKDIMTPRIDRLLSHPRVLVGNQIDQDDHDYESDLSSVASSSKHGSHLAVDAPKARKHRSTSVVQLRSTNYAATTTTDTGMPVLESGPTERARSQALRDVKARISVQEKRLSVHRMSRERVGSDGRISRERLGSDGRLTPRSISKKDVSSLSNTSLTAMSESELSTSESTDQLEEDALYFSGDRQPVASPPTAPVASPQRHHGRVDQDLEIIKEGSELEVVGERPRSATLPGNMTLTYSVFEPSSEDTDSKKGSSEGTGLKNKGTKNEEDRLYDLKRMGDHKFYSFTRYRKPSESCDLSEYTSNEHLDMFENVAVWDYPIFELEEKAGNHILSHMAHMLFHEAGLMETFKIPQREFVNYFRALEANYGSNVYHNKTHAADVLHAVSYLLFEMIPEFSHEFAYTDEQREWKGYSLGKNASGGNIASAFSILEVLACYMASAMHDFDHPGRTNAFLVGTKSPLAVLYNDRSVLENHHAAASWHLLTHFDENNFLTSLDEKELKRLRFLIIEAILATDLKMHFDILSTFRAKVNPEDGGGIDWSSEMDRMLVMKMLIKMADINTPTKSYELHRKWTERITEEFFQQSEEEENLNLPPTVFMDRKHPEKLPTVQLSFIQHLVSPLFQACAEAGIIPGISVPAEQSMVSPALGSKTEEGSPLEEPNSPLSEIKEDPLEDTAASTTERSAPPMEGEEVFGAESEQDSNFMSILLTNLQINYESWKAEIPPEPEEKGEEEAAEEKEGTEGKKNEEKDSEIEAEKAEAKAED